MVPTFQTLPQDFKWSSPGQLYFLFVNDADETDYQTWQYVYFVWHSKLKVSWFGGILSSRVQQNRAHYIFTFFVHVMIRWKFSQKLFVDDLYICMPGYTNSYKKTLFHV